MAEIHWLAAVRRVAVVVVGWAAFCSVAAATEPGLWLPPLEEGTVLIDEGAASGVFAEPLLDNPRPLDERAWYLGEDSSESATNTAFFQPSEVDDVVGDSVPHIIDDELRERIRRETAPRAVRRAVRRPSLSRGLFLTPHARIPGYGPLGDVLETGYGVGLHGFFPYSRPLFLSENSAWFYGVDTGFDYSYFEGKKGVNVNVPGGSNSIVHNADMYLFDLGLALCNARQVLGSDLVWYNSIALKGVIGGLAVDMKENVFNPQDKQVRAFQPQEDGFIRGGRLEWRSGVLLPNGYTLSAYGSGDFLTTDAITGRNLDTGLWTAGASIEIPLMPLRQVSSSIFFRDGGTLNIGGLR